MLNLQEQPSKIEVVATPMTSKSGAIGKTGRYTHHTQTVDTGDMLPPAAAASAVAVRKRKAVNKKNFIIFEHNDEDTLI